MLNYEYTDAVTIKTKLPNREHRRLAYFEFKKAVEALSMINHSFLKQVFTDEVTPYNNIYREHKYEWDIVSEYLLKHDKPKYIDIDINWFEKNYKPRI